MTNPMILKLMSSLLNGKPSGKVTPLKLGKGGRHFFPDMLKALNTAKNGSFHLDEQASKINTTSKRMNPTSNKKGYKYYLESFRKELLTRGKPLNKAYLKEKDIPLVKTFLVQCGFSHEKVEQFLKDLKANNPNGEFNISQILTKISELETPKRKKLQDETVAQAIIPHIESVLRDFNLSPVEIDRIFSNARIEGGGIDLQKLTKELKAISIQRSDGKKTAGNQKLSQQILETMGKIGMDIPAKGKADQISLAEFVTSLENFVEKAGKGNKVSPGIKNTIGKMIEQVEFSGQNPSQTPSVKVSAGYHFTDSLIKEEISKKDHHTLNDKKMTVLEQSQSDKNKSLSSVFKEQNLRVKNHIKADAAIYKHSEKADPVPDVNKKIELVNPVKVKGFHVDSETGQINVQRTNEIINFTDTLKTVEHGEKPFRSYLPDSLVDQVGKQISRSILRGDRVLTLHLKPPELGTVKVKLDIKDHTLKLGIITEHHSVKDILLNNVHELKEALVQHGVKLEKVDVQIDYNFGQSLNASKEGTGNGQGWKQEFNQDEFHSDLHREAPHEKSRNITSGRNLLDLVA